MGLKKPVIQKHFGRPKFILMIYEKQIMSSLDHSLTNYYIECTDRVIPKTKNQVYYFARNILPKQIGIMSYTMNFSNEPNLSEHDHRRSNQEFVEETR